VYALIMAGGVGSRLWPRSRKQTPKQLLNLTSERTMFQEAVARLAPLFEPAQIFVVTSADYVPAMREQVPELPAENYIVEPSGHGTAPCIGLAALYLRRLDPEAVMAVLTADHFIQRWDAFREALRAAGYLARQGRLVTLGIKPTFPSTGYGYILRDERLADLGQLEAYRVKRFTEKPDLPTARKFLATGRYYWNSGMFIWTIESILKAIEEHMPKLFKGLETIKDSLDTPREAQVTRQVFQKLESISIDYGVMEKAGNVVLVKADILWDDVGSWLAMERIHPKDDNGNVIIGKFEGIDSYNCIVINDGHLVATLGVSDLIVVTTPQATLICAKDTAQDVKKIVKKLADKKLEEYL